MMYTTRNQSHDTTENQKEKRPVSMRIFSAVSQILRG